MNGFLAWLNANRVELIIITIIVILFFILRTRSTDITFAEVIEPGEPMVVEVFSNT